MTHSDTIHAISVALSDLVAGRIDRLQYDLKIAEATNPLLTDEARTEARDTDHDGMAGREKEVYKKINANLLSG